MREAVKRLAVVRIGMWGCSSAGGVVVVVADTDAAPLDADGMEE